MIEVGLKRVEEIGLSVIALSRKQKLVEYNCSKCSGVLRESRNCERAPQDVDKLPPFALPTHPILGRMYTCPLRFIPDCVYEFIIEYDYYEKYPAKAPEFADLNPRFLLAMNYYEQILIEIDSIDKVHKDKSKGNMNKMAGLFK